MSWLRAHYIGLILVSAPLGALGCGGNVARGHALYSDGYYVEAAEVFERNERRLSEWPPEKRASYGLYRGMTLMQLGDHPGAARWLAYARWVSQEHPGTLRAQEVALLIEGQQALGYRIGPPGPAVHGAPVMATTNAVSPPPPSNVKSPPPTRKSFAD